MQMTFFFPFSTCYDAVRKYVLVVNTLRKKYVACRITVRIINSCCVYMPEINYLKLFSFSIRQ